MIWIDIGALEDIPLRGARKVKTKSGCIAVFRTEDQKVFATANECPHMGGPLVEGIVHSDKVTCPLHNWVFDLETGIAQGADQGEIETFPARIENGRVLIVAEQAGRSAA